MNDINRLNFGKERTMICFKGLSLAVAAVTTAGLLFVAPCYASPLETTDLNTSGDKLLTVDPNTGLQFLDPAVTSGLTYNQIGASNFVASQGFRFATTAEFQQLLSDGGITDFSGNFNTADVAAAVNLLTNFLGETIAGPITLPVGGATVSDGVYGFTDDPGVPAGQFNVAGLDYQSAALGEAPQNQARAILNLISFPGDVLPPNPGGEGINGSIVGGFLVRPVNGTPVPEPPGIALFATGLVGLGFVFCRQKQK